MAVATEVTISVEPFGPLPEGWHRDDEFMLVRDGKEFGPFGRTDIDMIRRSVKENVTVRLISQ